MRDRRAMTGRVAIAHAMRSCRGIGTQGQPSTIEGRGYSISRWKVTTWVWPISRACSASFSAR